MDFGSLENWREFSAVIFCPMTMMILTPSLFAVITSIDNFVQQIDIVAIFGAILFLALLLGGFKFEVQHDKITV